MAQRNELGFWNDAYDPDWIDQSDDMQICVDILSAILGLHAGTVRYYAFPAQPKDPDPLLWSGSLGFKWPISADVKPREEIDHAFMMQRQERRQRYSNAIR